MATFSPIEQDVVARLKEKLVAACGPRLLEVRVFGSRARGDALEDSDLDVFVMVDREDRQIRHAVTNACWEVACETDFPFSIIPLTMEKPRFDNLLGRERRIAKDIVSDGIPV